MDLIHVAIVEDEPLFVQQLKEYIGRYEKDGGDGLKLQPSQMERISQMITVEAMTSY